MNPKPNLTPNRSKRAADEVRAVRAVEPQEHQRHPRPVGTIPGSTNKGRFAATVGISKRVEVPPELLAGVQTTMEQLGLGLICVGGDGSLAI